MDKNTLVGFGLIGAVLIGFSYLSTPNKEQLAQKQHYKDSIQAVAAQQEAAQRAAEAAQQARQAQQSAMADSTAVFFDATKGEEKFYTLENSVAKLTFTNKGGRIYSAMLKKYNNQEKQALVLFKGDDAGMNFLFRDKKGEIDTKDLFFKPIQASDTTLTMRLVAGPASYIDFIYTMHPGNYMVNFEIKATGMEKILSPNTGYVDIAWNQRSPQIEKGYKFEERYSSLTYKLKGGDTDYLSQGKAVEESISGRLNWIAFKNQFFSSVFIANQDFEKNVLKSEPDKEGSGYLKNYSAKMSTFFDPTGQTPTHMNLYFGPNKYKILAAYDKGRAAVDKLELDELVPLGWSILRWINKWFTINLFDWLSGWGLGMGMVLLLMTIIVKIIIFPFTYKSYMSSTRMRVLKPQVDIIAKKYPNKEDAMKKQQETMALYNKYGVSPMSGCLPMILQMPILFALFMFVPTAIELRQQSFLWAPDLSATDTLISWNTSIPFIGSHISLFCLLFSITNILNTMYSMKQQDTGQSMPGMKIMTYVMPFMLIFILNDYPSGLNYYYFISSLISVIIMIAMKKVISDEKVLAQLEANKDNPTNKKKRPGLMARMEAMQKEQERIAKERQKHHRK